MILFKFVFHKSFGRNRCEKILTWNVRTILSPFCPVFFWLVEFCCSRIKTKREDLFSQQAACKLQAQPLSSCQNPEKNNNNNKREEISTEIFWTARCCCAYITTNLKTFLRIALIEVTLYYLLPSETCFLQDSMSGIWNSTFGSCPNVIDVNVFRVVQYFFYGKPVKTCKIRSV